jgi:hypothetical protein
VSPDEKAPAGKRRARAKAEKETGTKAPSPAKKPKFAFDDHALGDQKFMVADSEVKSTFGDATFESLQRGQSRWAARFSGDGLDGPSADPLRTAALIRRLAMTARWMANGLFPGNGGVPGFVLGAAAHSIVLEFALAPGEESVEVIVHDGIETETGDPDLVDKRRVYPTVEGGVYFGKLLASGEDEELLVERLGVVGKRAVLTYQGALKEFVEYDAEMDLLVPVATTVGEADLRRISVPPSTSERDLGVLNRVPEDVSDTIEVEGLLYATNSLSTEFGIQRDNGQHVTGGFDLRVADKLGPAWNKRVWARIEEIGPRQEWMPRAGRSRRSLIDVAVLKDGETRLKDASGG